MDYIVCLIKYINNDILLVFSGFIIYNFRINKGFILIPCLTNVTVEFLKILPLVNSNFFSKSLTCSYVAIHLANWTE